MIPEKLVDHLHGPRVLFLGTRNEKLRPAVSWVFGARAEAAADRVTVFLPDAEGEQSRKNLEDNGRVALTAVDPPTHEAYQFKGALVEMRPSTEEERAIQDIAIGKLAPHAAAVGIEPKLWDDFVLYPSTAVTFKVEDVFVQTPGPGAGDRIDLGTL